MAEYKVVFRADSETEGAHALTWEPRCPALVTAIQVSRNVENADTYLQVKIKNVSDEIVSSVEARAEIAYADGETQMITIEDLDADIPVGEEGALKPQKLPRADVESASLVLAHVNSPSSKWESSADSIQVPKQVELDISEWAMKERVRQLNKARVKACAHAGKVQENDGWWVCACGQVNVNRDSCCACGSEKSQLQAHEDGKKLEAAGEQWARSVYDEAVGLSDAGDIKSLKKAIPLFESLGDWENADQKLNAAKSNLATLKSETMKRWIRKAVIVAIAIIAVSIIGKFIADAVAKDQAQKSLPEVFMGLEIGDSKDALDEATSKLPTKEKSAKEPYIYDSGYAYVEINNAYVGDMKGWTDFRLSNGKITAAYWKAVGSGKVSLQSDEVYNADLYNAVKDYLDKRYGEPMSSNGSISITDGYELLDGVLKYETGNGQVLYLGYGGPTGSKYSSYNVSKETVRAKGGVYITLESKS